MHGGAFRANSFTLIARTCCSVSGLLSAIDSACLFQVRDPIEFRLVQIKQNDIRVFLVIKLEAFPTIALHVGFWPPVVEQVWKALAFMRRSAYIWPRRRQLLVPRNEC